MSDSKKTEQNGTGTAIPDASFDCAVDALAAWRDDVLSGKPPVRWPLGTGELGGIECGPGAVLLVGGAPGAGKTAFTMQAAVDALRLTPDLRAVVCNVEMSPAALLDRQLARLSGIDLTVIRRRRLEAEHADRIDRAMQTLEPLAERLAFVRPPFDLENVAATADAFEAQLLLDYIQRIPPPGEHGDRRGAVNATMDFLRQFADAGTAVIVVSAIGRTKDSKGRSSYHADGLNLASFRESSELEFGADDAFILSADDDQGDTVTLRHLKSRHGECRDIELLFHRRHQRFEAARTGHQSPAAAGNLQAALAALWNQTPPSAETEGGEEE
jgi:replicative DNA helicase